jgi:membrane associated rhomboid family serine protease
LSHREPIFNVPGVVLALLASFVAVHVLLWALPANDSDWLMQVLAFIPARLGHGAGALPGGDAAAVTSLVTHQFIHGNLPHLLINSAWLLAFGTPIARRTDPLRFIAFFLLCGIAGALMFFAINGTTHILMVGASGAISGLMGAAFRLVFRGMERGGPSGLANVSRIPLMPLSETLRNRRILAIIVGWTLLNILLAEGASGMVEAAGIAWEAHLGGFYAGLLLYGLFDRPPPVLADDAAPAE